jgi:hypothetical protein
MVDGASSAAGYRRSDGAGFIHDSKQAIGACDCYSKRYDGGRTLRRCAVLAGQLSAQATCDNGRDKKITTHKNFGAATF